MEMDTNHPIAKFLSSQRMESSETRNRIINLGKSLVVELNLDPGVDTLARWMAHYIAEQMEIADTAKDDDKAKAEQKCFETILKFWYHRSSFPNGRRPFEKFEPVFRALERLDPENPSPFFYSYPNFHSAESDDSGEDPDDVQRWLDIARGIDQAARVWLEYVFHQAALNATDQKTISYLEKSVGLPSNIDVSIIVGLLQSEPENESEEIAVRERQAKQEKIKSRIKQLDAFIDFNQDLRAAFVNELENMT